MKHCLEHSLDNFGFVFEIRELCICLDDHTKLCHKLWKENGVHSLHLVTRNPTHGQGQFYVAKTGEDAHYESTIVEIMKAMSSYKGQLCVFLYDKRLDYHTNFILISNNQKIFWWFVEHVDWEESRKAAKKTKVLPALSKQTPGKRLETLPARG